MDRDVSLRAALLLHLCPGACIAIGYALLLPVAARLALPHVAALLAAFVLAGIPLQLAVIRKRSAAVGHSVVHFRQPMPLWQHVAGVIVLIGVVALLLRLPLGRVSDSLAQHVFGWLPPPFGPSADDDLARATRSVLLPLLILQLVIDGVINPLIEERYFRGFLLPQLGSLRLAAPIVNTALFALGHFWQPHNYLSIFVYVLPLTFFTWWRKNYYAQAFVHCLANSLGATIALVTYMRS